MTRELNQSRPITLRDAKMESCINDPNREIKSCIIAYQRCTVTLSNKRTTKTKKIVQNKW